MTTAAPPDRPDGWHSVPHRMGIGLRYQQRDDGTIPSENVTCFLFAFPEPAVEPARLERALGWTVRANPALTSRYRVHPDLGPQYRTEPPWQPLLEVVDLGAVGRHELHETARRIADAEIRNPFDLRDGRLLKVVCVRSEGAGCCLVIKIDHTVCDGISYAQFLDDLHEAYGGDDESRFLAARRRASLARVAAAERRALAGGGESGLRAAWRQRLPAGIPETVLERPVPWRELTSEGEQASVRLTGADYQRHVREARELRVSGFMLATAKVLHAMRPSVLGEGLSFFSPFPGRFVPQARGVLGNFVSVLPVTVDAPPSAGLPETVAAVREGVLWTMRHQGLPYDAVLDAVGNADGTSGEFSYERRSVFISGNPPLGLELGGVRGEIDVPTLTDAMFDISLWISDSGDGLRCSTVFRRQLLSRPLVEAWLDSLRIPFPR
ncbi:condensation domain-containing protein [Streptomyces sp. NPDC001606]